MLSRFRGSVEGGVEGVRPSLFPLTEADLSLDDSPTSRQHLWSLLPTSSVVLADPHHVS